MRRFLQYTILAAMSFCLLQPITTEAATVSSVSSVSIDPGKIEDPKIEMEDTSVTMKKGTMKELDVDVTTHELDNNDYEIRWSSTNKKVATVSENGKVKAKRSGTCTVKAKLSGTDVETKCKIIVKSTKGNKLKYGSRFDKRVTRASLKKKSGREIKDNAGNIYTKGKKIGNFVITGYCTHCNSGGSRATSSGKKATEGITVAVNSSQIPLGTKLVIGNHVYIAQDRHGNRRHAKVIDVFFGTHHGSECFLKNIPVYIAK